MVLSTCESKLNYILARPPCMEAYQLILDPVAKQHRMYFGCHIKVLFSEDQHIAKNYQSKVISFFQPLAVLVCASVGILWACYPLLTIQVYSGDAKVSHGQR